MRKKIYLILSLLLMLFAVSSCNNSTIDTRKFQETLYAQEAKADALLDEVTGILTSADPDSIIQYAQSDNADILFYIFNRNELIFWTDNKIAIQEIRLNTHGQWFYQKFMNAHCVCRWNSVNGYNMLTILPIKYNYWQETQQLQNEFIPPFRLNKQIAITQNDIFPNSIYSVDGSFLFSLHHTETASTNISTEHFTKSFSYSELLTPENDSSDKHTRYFSRTQLRLYFLLALLILFSSFIFITYSIYKYKGFKNLRLSHRFSIVFISLFSISLIGIFWVSVIHIRDQYKARQQKELQQKTLYIQKALQEIYFWHRMLDESHASSLNIELRDLSFTYKTDIHVYDQNGIMVGSSQPLMFKHGFLSRRISPIPYFSGETNITQTEGIGNFEYISSYTDFYNGDFVNLGYIAVPLFISSVEIADEIDDLLSRLVPVYIAVMLVFFAFSFLVSRQIAAPINMMVRTLEKFGLDQPNEHIDYQPKDEIGMIVNEYNKLVDKLDESAQKLAKSEREGAWKTMARQIAHEINNPLTPMKLTIQQLRRIKEIDSERFDQTFDGSTTLLIEQINNLSRIAGMFSNFAKLPEIRLSQVDISAKINSVASLFTTNREHVTIRCVGTEHSIYATTDEKQITQVFNNLIKNAIQAVSKCTHDGHIIIELCDEEEKVIVSVHDNGCGIPTEIQSKIFRPNFTTKNTGMGLGLAISKNIVEGSGGTIGFISKEGFGTMFMVELKKELNA